MNKPFFTIFTPVYNGEKFLHRVFESVRMQTYKNFEWIIVNDGSIDNTSILIKAFINQHPDIDIIYLEQENSGKHISWNRAINLARGELFVPADADDSFIPDTLSFFYEKWSTLTQEEKLSFCGIDVQCFDNDTTNFVGTPYPYNGMKTNHMELEFKYKVTGEKWGCIRVDLLKCRPFPIMKGSHFPEDYLWLDISKKYQVICFNKAFRRYYTTDTGITQSQKKNRNSLAQSKIILKSNFWVISNFGLYIIIHSPIKFLKISYHISKLLFYIFSNKVNINSK